MDKLTLARAVIAFLAIAVWGTGYATENTTLRLLGMGLMAVALVLRFARRLRRANDDASRG